MAKVVVTEQYLEDIADAIREKVGGSDTYKPSEMASAIESISGSTPILPSAYQQVEYLRSSGAQYINTGVIPNNNMRIQIKCQNLIAADDDVIMGGTNGSGSQTWIADALDIMKFTYRMGADTISGKTFSTADPHVVDFNDDQDRIMVNDVNILNVSNKYSLTPTYNLYMFAGNNNGSVTYYTTCFIWYCRIINKTDDSYIRNFYPCYRKSDDKPGMYDLVNDVFYVNQGNGADFTVGPDVN